MLIPMKRFALCLLVCLTALWSAAQTDQPSMRREFDDAFMHPEADSLAAGKQRKEVRLADSLKMAQLPAEQTDLYLPFYLASPALSPAVPYASAWASPWGSFGNDFPAWRLHEGLNSQFGLNATVGLGKHAPRGVGFGQSLALAYAFPLKDRLFAAAGVYANHFDWGGWRTTGAGFAGLVGYELSDICTLYAFGSKSFVPRRNDLRFHGRQLPIFRFEPKERLGAAAEFKVGENAVIGISVERVGY